MITGLCEITLQARDIASLERFYVDTLGLGVISRDRDRVWLAIGDRGVEVEGPVEHPGGDRSIYFTDPEGNVAALWDFFEQKTVEALAS